MGRCAKQIKTHAGISIVPEEQILDILRTENNAVEADLQDSYGTTLIQYRTLLMWE